MPHLPWGQHVEYMFETPTTRVWKQLFDEGKLTPEQAYFWQVPKATEELYDLATDPDEVHNLAADPAYQGKLKELRAVLREHILQTRDLGFLPEDEIHARAGNGSPYRYGQSKDYPLERILEMAELASDLKSGQIDKLLQGLQDSDSAVRYWAVTGILARGQKAYDAAREPILHALDDPAPSVQIVAAWTVGRYGSPEELQRALDVLKVFVDYEGKGPYLSMLALNALNDLGTKSEPVKSVVESFNPEIRREHGRLGENLFKLKRSILAKLGADTTTGAATTMR